MNDSSVYTVGFYSNCNEAVPAQTVSKDAKLALPADPVRKGYTFLGWYLNGKKFDFSEAPVQNCTLVAHWKKNDPSIESYYTSAAKGKEVRFNGINAGLHIVWKDCANRAGIRPSEVVCLLTQSCGKAQKTYEIVLGQKSVAWKGGSPEGCALSQGAGGDWTLSLKNLPEKVGKESCSYKLVQKPLAGDYATLQSGTEVTNTVRGYVPGKDATVKLTTRNSRLYDAAGNMIVFKGVVTYNLGIVSNLDRNTTPEALRRLASFGCNAIRVSSQLIGAKGQANGYVYYRNGSPRTGDYGDEDVYDENGNLIKKADERTSEEEKQKMMKQLDAVIERATEAGLYIVIDWAILTSNPYQYVKEAGDFFGRLAEKHKDNPYVLFEICNEPGKTAWRDNPDGSKGVKSYVEEIIDVVRGKGSDAVIIASPRGSAYYISIGASEPNAGDDPIGDPLDDDRRRNVAYTFHNYSYINAYAVGSDPKTDPGFAWRLRDAYDAGLTIVTTEMSPMDPSFSYRDTLGYDMAQMKLYMRLFQEYDMSFFYFRYGSIASAYHEWFMFKPNAFNAQWTRDDLSECGKWYFDLITSDGVFLTGLDYNAVRVIELRDRYQTTFAPFGLESRYKVNPVFTPFPSFTIGERKLNDTTYYFTVGESDSLTDLQYEGYCKRLWVRISEICESDSAKLPNGAAFADENVPAKRTVPMEISYRFNGKTCKLKISYGKSKSDSGWGIFFDLQ